MLNPAVVAPPPDKSVRRVVIDRIGGLFPRGIRRDGSSLEVRAWTPFCVRAENQQIIPKPARTKDQIPLESAVSTGHATIKIVVSPTLDLAAERRFTTLEGSALNLVSNLYCHAFFLKRLTMPVLADL